MLVGIYNTPASEIANDRISQQAGTQTSATSTPVNPEDRTTLSSDSTSVGNLVATALATPAVRQDKVDSLRNSISTGTYKIEPNEIAASIIDEHA